VLALGLSSAHAQDTSGVPAEFPPSSFTGKQYVDSKGCVFVRAGFDGAVNWVPRVSRKRKALCGFSPTFASQPAPELAPATVVAETPAPAPVATPPRATVAVKPAPVVRPAPTRVVAAPPRATRPAPSRVVRAAPVQPVRVAPVQAAPRVAPPAQVATSCPGMSALSQRYLQSKHKVRCGPQGTSPTSGIVQGTPNYPPGTRLAAPAQTFDPPAGYRAAFTDDRLNPYRGLQTRRGFEQMRLVWTAGVPRRLVDQQSGRDVTGLFPGLRFPFINYQAQQAYVEANGSENWPSPGVATTADPVVSAKNIKPTATIAKPAPAPSNGHRYVQVGAFSNPTNVTNSVAILRKLGLPVSVGSYKKRGKTYKVVLAGPFNNASRLNAGLSAARRAGFREAYTRK